MATYHVYVFCNDCSNVHPMGIQINLKDGPAQKESIGNLFAGKQLPPEIVTLLNNKIKCPSTGKWITQEDNNQVFIVPVS